MGFKERLEKIVAQNDSLVCVGLDTDPKKIPQSVSKKAEPIFEFNKAIIKATADLVCAYKPQIAFYAAEGEKGLKALKKTVEHLKKNFPRIPIICDAKRGDIGSTAAKYAQEVFDWFGFDAVTVNPYLGFDSIEPFLKREDKGIIILCRTSNPGAADFQDLKIKGVPLYQIVAEKIVTWNKQYRNCLMVVGATWPRELKKVREMAPNVPFLVPGVGAQGGDVEAVLKNGQDKSGAGLIINSSRGIIYASSGPDFAKAARVETEKLRNEINKYRR